MSLQNTNTAPAVPIKEGLLLFILAAINFTHIMDFVIMAPLNPILSKALSLSPQKFSFLQASYALSAGLAGIAGAFFVDKFDRRTTLIFLYSGFTISNLACAISPEYYSLMTSRTLAGAFGGVLGSVLLSVVGDVIPQERRGKATGIVMSAFSAASVIGLPIGIILGKNIDWHAPFYFITILSLIVLIFTWLKMPSITSHINNLNFDATLQKIKGLFLNPNVRWSFLFMSLLMISGLTVVPFLSDYIVNNIKLSEDNLHHVYFYGGLATAISGPLTGRLADKFGKPRVFLIAGLISVIPIYIMTHLPESSYGFTLVMSSIFFIFFGARFVPAMSMMTSSVELRQRGSFMSINSSIQQFSSSIAILTAGAIIVKNNNGSLENFGICGIISIVALVACILVSFKLKQVS